MAEILTEQKIDQFEKIILRIYIDGQWSLNDFKVLFEQIEELYYYLSVKKSIIDPIPHGGLGEIGSPFILYKDELFCHAYINRVILNRDSIYLGRSRADRIYKIRTDNDYSQNREEIFGTLLVKRISYSSPGSLDIFGFGNVIKEIKNFILDLIKSKKTLRMMDLENQEKEQEIEGMRKDNEIKDVEKTSKEIENELKRKQLQLRELEIKEKELEIEEKKALIEKIKLETLNSPQREEEFNTIMQTRGYSKEEQEKIRQYELQRINAVNELLQSDKVKDVELIIESTESNK